MKRRERRDKKPNDADYSRWRHSFGAILECMQTPEVVSCLRAIEHYDRSLIHDAVTLPVPLPQTMEWECQGACLVAYGPWKVKQLRSVREVYAHFQSIILSAQMLLNQEIDVEEFLRFWDSDEHVLEIRKYVRRELHYEIIRREA